MDNISNPYSIIEPKLKNLESLSKVPPEQVKNMRLTSEGVQPKTFQGRVAKFITRESSLENIAASVSNLEEVYAYLIENKCLTDEKKETLKKAGVVLEAFLEEKRASEAKEGGALEGPILPQNAEEIKRRREYIQNCRLIVLKVLQEIYPEIDELSSPKANDVYNYEKLIKKADGSYGYCKRLDSESSEELFQERALIFESLAYILKMREVDDKKDPIRLKKINRCIKNLLQILQKNLKLHDKEMKSEVGYLDRKLLNVVYSNTQSVHETLKLILLNQMDLIDEEIRLKETDEGLFIAVKNNHGLSINKSPGIEAFKFASDFTLRENKEIASLGKKCVENILTYLVKSDELQAFKFYGFEDRMALSAAFDPKLKNDEGVKTLANLYSLSALTEEIKEDVSRFRLIKNKEGSFNYEPTSIQSIIDKFRSVNHERTNLTEAFRFIEGLYKEHSKNRNILTLCDKAYENLKSFYISSIKRGKIPDDLQTAYDNCSLLKRNRWIE